MTILISKIVAITVATAVITSIPYVKDFSKLSKEADALAAETEEIKKAVIEDTADRRSLASISEADEWDTSIRIGLTTWRDLIWPEGDSGSDGEIRSWRKSNAPEAVNERKRMIGMMRARCKKGLSLRKALRPQLQRIHLGLIARSDLNIRAAYTMGANADFGLSNGIWSTAALTASWYGPTMRGLKDMAACRVIGHSVLLATGDLPNAFARP